MPYNPGVTYQGGEYIARGIEKFGKEVGAGIKQYWQDKQEHEALSGAAEQLGMFRTEQGLPPLDAGVLKKFGSGGLAAKRTLLGQVMGQTNFELRKLEYADQRAIEKLKLEELRRSSGLAIAEQSRRDEFRKSLIKEMAGPEPYMRDAEPAPMRDGGLGLGLPARYPARGLGLGGFFPTESPGIPTAEPPNLESMPISRFGLSRDARTEPTQTDAAALPAWAPQPKQISPEMIRRIAAQTQVDPKWASEYLGWYDPDLVGQAEKRYTWDRYVDKDTGHVLIGRGGSTLDIGMIPQSEQRKFPKIPGMKIVKVAEDDKGVLKPVYERIVGTPDQWIKTPAKGIFFDPVSETTFRERTPGQFEIVREWEDEEMGGKTTPQTPNETITRRVIRDANGNLVPLRK